MEFKTNYAKEMERWNTPRSQGGMRPNGFEEFPVMLYKPRRPPSGGPYIVINPLDESWSMANCQTAKNEEERQRLLRQGFRQSPQEAIEEANRAEDAVAKAAAHRAHEDRNMSELAQREIAQAVEESGMAHDAEIPEKPRRGRPRKIKTEAV